MTHRFFVQPLVREPLDELGHDLAIASAHARFWGFWFEIDTREFALNRVTPLDRGIEFALDLASLHCA